jgi:hypothetical protein
LTLSVIKELNDYREKPKPNNCNTDRCPRAAAKVHLVAPTTKIEQLRL